MGSSNYYIYTGIIIKTKNNIYWVDEYINKGEYSSVYKCTDINNNIYAMKVIDIKNDKGVSNSNQHYDKNDIYKEIEILKKCEHPHIIKFIDYHEDRYHIYIITEYIQGTELYNLISQDSLEEDEALVILISILKALIYLNNIGIMHLDIKAENIIIGEDQKIKLIDFGHSQYIDDDINQIKGTMGYIAPEVINCQYNNNPDIWSLGCLLYYILKTELPYSSYEYKNGFYRDLFTEDNSISYNFIYIINRMLSFNNRPKAEKIYNDNFIKGNMSIYYNEINENINV